MLDINITNDDSIELSDPLHAYIQQIMMIINTSNDEVLGCSTMNLDLEHMIYETNVDGRNLSKMILRKIAEYTTYYNMFDTTVEVKFGKGTLRDVCLIDIIIDSQKRLGFVIK